MIVEPDTGNLIVSLGESGVVIRDAQGQWKRAQVGPTMVGIPPAATAQTAPMQTWWVMWGFTTLFGVFQIRSSVKARCGEEAKTGPATSRGFPSQWQAWTAMSATTVALGWTLVTSANYPYGLPGVPHSIRMALNYLAMPIVPALTFAFLALWGHKHRSSMSTILSAVVAAVLTGSILLLLIISAIDPSNPPTFCG